MEIFISNFTQPEDKDRAAGRPVGLASAGLPLVTFLQLLYTDQRYLLQRQITFLTGSTASLPSTAVATYSTSHPNSHVWRAKCRAGTQLHLLHQVLVQCSGQLHTYQQNYR